MWILSLIKFFFRLAILCALLAIALYLTLPYLLENYSRYVFPRFGVKTLELSGTKLSGTRLSFDHGHIVYDSASFTADITIEQGALNSESADFSDKKLSALTAGILTANIQLKDSETASATQNKLLALIPLRSAEIEDLRFNLSASKETGFTPLSLNARLSLQTLTSSVIETILIIKIEHADITTPKFVVKNLNTTFEAVENSSIKLRPFNLTAKRLEAGVLLSDLQFKLAYDQQLLRVSSASSNFLGGTLTIDPTNLKLEGAASNVLPLHFNGVEIPQLLALYPSEKISGEGKISAYLPIKFENKELSLSTGDFKSDQKGFLRAQLDTGTAPEEVSFAAKALSNLQFENINGAITLTNTGDMTLTVQIQGKNPELNKGQPLNVNLSIEENLPSLLTSLKIAGRLVGK